MIRPLTIPLDTDADAARVQLAALRRLTGPQRLAMSLRMGTALRQQIEAGVRHQRPGFSPLEVRRETNRRLLDTARFQELPAPRGTGAEMDQSQFLLEIVETLSLLGIEFLGRPVFVATAEDVILSKLEWAQRGGSERQLRDAEGVVRLQGEMLDRAYLRRWAGELKVSGELEALLECVDEAERGP